jgi:hypothetical protein
MTWFFQTFQVKQPYLGFFNHFLLGVQWLPDWFSIVCSALWNRKRGHIYFMKPCAWDIFVSLNWTWSGEIIDLRTPVYLHDSLLPCNDIFVNLWKSPSCAICQLYDFTAASALQCKKFGKLKRIRGDNFFLKWNRWSVLFIQDVLSVVHKLTNMSLHGSNESCKYTGVHMF